MKKFLIAQLFILFSFIAAFTVAQPGQPPQQAVVKVPMGGMLAYCPTSVTLNVPYARTSDDQGRPVVFSGYNSAVWYVDLLPRLEIVTEPWVHHSEIGDDPNPFRLWFWTDNNLPGFPYRLSMASIGDSDMVVQQEPGPALGNVR